MDRIEVFEKTHENILSMPNIDTSMNEENIPTPKSDKIIMESIKLKELSNYKTSFDFEMYRKLELRFGHNQPRGGIVFGKTFRLVNSHSTCQQCLYAFEIDTYGRGCVHDCVYCYAKAQLTVHGAWNKPFPMPIDITQVWKTFYTVFETSKRSKWRKILEKRIPLRIGSMSDSFMAMDKKYKVTQELLKILDHYDYPYIIFTRGDIIAHDDYISLLNPDLCSIQMSIPSTNDKMNKLIEPGAPSAKRRLKALEKLVKNGFWTTVRINPFFPMYPDGYYTDPNFDREKMPEPFHYSSFEMIEEIASYGVQSILAGVVRLSGYSLNQIEKATGRELRSFYNKDKKTRDYTYSDKEVRAYYERIQAKCIQNGVQFTTCYIGNGEKQFWSDQDLWSNKEDCCNVKGVIKSFKTDSRNILWEERMKHSASKNSIPNSVENLHKDLSDQDILIIKSGKITINPELLRL